MTLEDFFTLTELKDGLTAPERVNELITMMQKENDSVVKNFGEAARQWSTVASTIAATESKDCLDLFVHLDGLCFIDRWLKDAQKLGNDADNSFFDESITMLLRAVERLQIDNHGSFSSGIGKTVQNLVDHGSSGVRDIAKVLCDRWMLIQDNDAGPQDVKNHEALGDDETPSLSISPSHTNDSDENKIEKPRDETMQLVSNIDKSRDETMQLVSLDTVQQVMINKEEITDQDIVTDTATTSQEPLDHVNTSGESTNDGRNLLVKFEAPKSESEVTILTETYGSTPAVEGSTCVGQLDVSQPDKYVKDAKEEINCQDKAGLVEISTLSSPLEQIASSADVDNALESSIKTDLRDDKDEDMVDDGASPDHFRSTFSFKARNKVGVFGANTLQDSHGDECKWGEADSPKTSSNSKSDREADNANEHDGVQSNENLGNGSHLFKLSVNARGDGVKSMTSDMELDYGMVDPLEVARQVAIEVEREFDSRERSCSTSDKMSGGEIERPSTPDSANGKESPPKEVSSGREPSPNPSPSVAEPVKNAETLISERESCKPDITASQISEVAQESEANTERGFSGFDLNQEVCSEEVDNLINPVLPLISVVSASRAAASADVPVAPLRFEGTQGWKGSASTSAFRRIPEGDKALSSRTHNNSKQRLDCLDIDLNVAEGSEDKIEDFLSQKKMQIISGLPSGEESSVEASPRRPERLQLDLNSLGDEGADGVGLDWRQDGRVASVNQIVWQSPSRSSSSSSKQPSLRNIDLNLNDQPVLPNGASLDHPYLGKLSNHSSASGGAFKQEQSVISIFGTKVEVKRKESLPQPSGRILEPTVDFSLGRTGDGFGLGSSAHYGNPPLYGHNGFASGAAMFFSSPMYGSPGMPIPYLVDARGVPVVPQIMGSSSAPSHAFSQPPPPFIMNMVATGTSSGSSVGGPSQHNFDMNAGLMIEGGNRENVGGLRQLFHHSGRSVDEQYSRANNSLQASSSSVVGGKRHEPDGRWEVFPVNKHQQPPWR